MRQWINHHYTPCTSKLFHSVHPTVCPSVCPSVRPASRVRSVAPTVLFGSISYLCNLSSNLRRCVACEIACKILRFVFLAFFFICNFDFVLFSFGIWCESLVWVIMGQRGVSQKAGILVGSDNGLTAGRRQAIIWTSVGILIIRNKLRWILNKNLCIFNQENAPKRIVWKMPVILSRPQCVCSAENSALIQSLMLNMYIASYPPLRLPHRIDSLVFHTWNKSYHDDFDSWWRHQIETFPALLPLCEGHPPVTGEVSFDLRLKLHAFMYTNWLSWNVHNSHHSNSQIPVLCPFNSTMNDLFATKHFPLFPRYRVMHTRVSKLGH